MKDTASDYLTNYYKREIRVLKQSLNKASKGFNKKAIHQLRVSIKKLKAFYKLIETLYPHEFNTAKHLMPFHEAFENAGILRETQVNKELIKDYSVSQSSLKGYNSYLTMQEGKADKNLKKNISVIKTSKPGTYRHEISKLCKNLNDSHFNKECNSFIKKKVKKIKELRTSPASRKTLHQIRKHLKQVVYIINIQQKTTPGTYTQNFIKELKHTEVMIGNWHDHVILIASLKDYESQAHPPVAKTLKKIITAITNQNKRQAQLLKPKIDLIVKTCLNL